MAHSLFRLTETIFNRPHCITATAFSQVIDYLINRNSGVASLERFDDAPAEVETAPTYANGIGVLQVSGTLTYKPVMTMCGEVGTSYQSLVAQTEDMAEAGVHTIVMEVNSGGGQAAGCFEAAAEIRSICDENGIQLIGYADEQACSGAYALVCVCDVIIANPSADVGSIGVVVGLMDTSKAMQMAGLKPVFITAGDSKVPYDADGSFKQSFLDDIQAEVDSTNDEFMAHVSKFTGLGVKTIRGFEAKVFNANTAQSLGLINTVMTNKEFAQFVAQSTQGIQ